MPFHIKAKSVHWGEVRGPEVRKNSTFPPPLHPARSVGAPSPAESSTIAVHLDCSRSNLPVTPPTMPVTCANFDNRECCGGQCFWLNGVVVWHNRLSVSMCLRVLRTAQSPNRSIQRKNPRPAESSGICKVLDEKHSRRASAAGVEDSPVVSPHADTSTRWITITIHNTRYRTEGKPNDSPERRTHGAHATIGPDAQQTRRVDRAAIQQ